MKFGVTIKLLCVTYLLFLDFKIVYGKKFDSLSSLDSTEIEDDEITIQDRRRIRRNARKSKKGHAKPKRKSVFAMLKDPSSYKFANPKDKEECEILKFEPITEFRRYSGKIKMNVVSAAECCGMRGMRLYSVERIDDRDFSASVQTKLGQDTWFWSSANNHNSSTFLWLYGMEIGGQVDGFVKQDTTVWDKGQPSKDGHCAVAKARSSTVTLKVADCEKELFPFMCEMEPQTAGHDVTPEEMQQCIKANKVPLPSFPTLMLFEGLTTRWRVANYCCQMKNWSLLDQVKKRGDNLYSDLMKHKATSGSMQSNQNGDPRPWSSGNDFCKFRQWAWACQENETIPGIGFVQGEPNNLGARENCLEFLRSNNRLEGNDISCDTKNFVICESKPECDVEEQYACGDGPRTYDVVESQKNCPKRFNKLKGTSYSLSSKPVSWATSLSCCEEAGLQPINTFTPADLQKLKDVLKDKAVWTSATNWLKGDPKLKKLPLKWPNGQVVSEALSNKEYFPLHGQMYPLCGKVIVIDPYGVMLITANCMDENYVICSAATCIKRPNESTTVKPKKEEKDEFKTDSPNKELRKREKDKGSKKKKNTPRKGKGGKKSKGGKNSKDSESHEGHGGMNSGGGGGFSGGEGCDSSGQRGLLGRFFGLLGGGKSPCHSGGGQMTYGGGGGDSGSSREGQSSESSNGGSGGSEESSDSHPEPDSPSEKEKVTKSVEDNIEPPPTGLSVVDKKSSKKTKKKIPKKKPSSNHSGKPNLNCVTPATREDYQEFCTNSSVNISVTNKAIKSFIEKSGFRDDVKFQINTQNKMLLNSLVSIGVYGKLIKEHSPKFGFRLMSTSTAIYSRICKIVPYDFIDNAFNLFHELHWMSSSGLRLDLIIENEYKWILNILNNCKPKLLSEQTDKCKEEFLAVGNCTNFVCTSDPNEFKLYRTDPLIDIMWKVYEMIHAMCFPAFMQGYRMFHKYSQSMMHLWTSYIKLRWHNQLADDNYWRRLLGFNYETHLVNMERCNEAQISRSKLPYRLGRETLPNRARLHGHTGAEVAPEIMVRLTSDLPECKP